MVSIECELKSRLFVSLLLWKAYQILGAGLFLHATPSKTGELDNEPALFVAMLQRWLRIPFADRDQECPRCDGVLDRYGCACAPRLLPRE